MMNTSLLSVEKRTKEKVEALGRNYKGFSVIPSTTLFYYRFPYKARLKGNSAFYNIPIYKELEEFLYENYFGDYRLLASTSCINFYITKKSAFDLVIEKFGDLIIDLSGPIDSTNLEIIDNLNPNVAYRNKYWYNKYDTKIEFCVINAKVEDNTLLRKDIMSFVKSNFTEYQWYNNGTAQWYENFLYCKSQEFESVLPFLKISFSDYIVNTKKVTLF